MENNVAICMFLFCISGLILGEQDKRVLLHSDQDLYQVMSSLQAEVASLKSEIISSDANMAALNASMQTEIAALKSDIASSNARMATQNASTEAEITTLKSSISILNTSSQSAIATLKSKVSNLESNILSAPLKSGSVYVRWGRTSCPGNGTEMVYTGRMAGGRYNISGGANSLCLPNDPTWGKYIDGIPIPGTIYGTELYVVDNLANVLFGRAVIDEDVPCAVCRTSRPSNVMISGRATCYPGWTLEYQGYLFGGHSSFQDNVDYACLDSGLEFAPHGAADDNDHLIYAVGAVCGKAGSLPCPPYVNRRILSCVVCSK